MTTKFKQITYSLFILSIVISSCKKDNEINPTEDTNKSIVPEFFKGSNGLSPEFLEIANSTSQIAIPQDLDFNPIRQNELWIINKGTENTGGSTVMLIEVGTPQQKYDYRRDGNAWHFMSLPSALSFSKNGNWATSANVLDANHSGGTFTGPTLWSSDLDIYAKDHGPGTNGSHLDMLHTSPYSMGIESESENIFWVFDGYNGNIVKYNFAADHGPGQHYHGDGKVHRYTEVKIKREPNVPSHMVLDNNLQWLYIVDGGNKRILRMNIQTGKKLRDLPLVNEELAEYWEMSGTIWEEFIPSSFGLNKPCGIEISENRLFVSDYETGEIICFDLNTKTEISRINTGSKGIMGITLGPDKLLYFVNSIKNNIQKINPIN